MNTTPLKKLDLSDSRLLSNMPLDSVHYLLETAQTQVKSTLGLKEGRIARAEIISICFDNPNYWINNNPIIKRNDITHEFELGIFVPNTIYYEPPTGMYYIYTLSYTLLPIVPKTEGCCFVGKQTHVTSGLIKGGLLYLVSEKTCRLTPTAIDTVVDEFYRLGLL